MAVTNFQGSNFLSFTGALWPGQEPYLLSVWFQRPDNVSASTIYSMGSVDGSEDHSRSQSVFSGADVATRSRDTVNANANTSTLITVDTWHNLQSAWVSDSLREAWLDGAGKGNNTVTKPLNAPTVTRIGQRTDGVAAAGTLAGIAEISIWDLAGLSAADRDSLASKLATLVGGNAPNPKAVNDEVGQVWSGKLWDYWQLLDNTDLTSVVGSRVLTINGTINNFASHPPVDGLPAAAKNFSQGFSGGMQAMSGGFQ